MSGFNAARVINVARCARFHAQSLPQMKLHFFIGPPVFILACGFECFSGLFVLTPRYDQDSILDFCQSERRACLVPGKAGRALGPGMCACIQKWALMELGDLAVKTVPQAAVSAAVLSGCRRHSYSVVRVLCHKAR